MMCRAKSATTNWIFIAFSLLDDLSFRVRKRKVLKMYLKEIKMLIGFREQISKFKFVVIILRN